MQKGFVIILILSIIIGIFAISNSGVVAIDFIFTEVLLSQAIVIFICVLLGALLATIFGGLRQISLKKNIKELTKENQAIKAEVYEIKVQRDKLSEDLKVKEEELIFLNSKAKEEEPNLMNSQENSIITVPEESIDKDDI